MERRGRRPLQYISVTMDVFTPNTEKVFLYAEKRAAKRRPYK